MGAGQPGSVVVVAVVGSVVVVAVVGSVVVVVGSVVVVAVVGSVVVVGSLVVVLVDVVGSLVVGSLVVVVVVVVVVWSHWATWTCWAWSSGSWSCPSATWRRRACSTRRGAAARRGRVLVELEPVGEGGRRYRGCRAAAARSGVLAHARAGRLGAGARRGDRRRAGGSNRAGRAAAPARRSGPCSRWSIRAGSAVLAHRRRESATCPGPARAPPSWLRGRVRIACSGASRVLNTLLSPAGAILAAWAGASG